MKRFTISFLLLLMLAVATFLPFPRGWYPHHTWTWKQSAHNTACTTSTSTCVITVAATTAGSALVFFVGSGTNADSISAAATGAGTMVLCPASACNLLNTNVQVDSAYVPSSTGGITSLTVTMASTVTGIWSAYVQEYTYTSGPVTFDVGGTLNTASCTTSCTGVPLTLTGKNDLIAQNCYGVPNCTAVSSPYSNEVDLSNGSGFATSANTLSGTAPTWTLSATGHMVWTALALTESANPALASPFVIAP